MDCDWSYLKTLRTLKAPHEAMPRLRDLLEFLNTPGLEDTWILLDIKLDDDADDMMRLIAKTLDDVKPTRPWNERIALGCWAVSVPQGRLLQSLRLTTILDEVHSSMLKIPTYIPNRPYWLQCGLCARVLEDSQCLIQSPTYDCCWTRRKRFSARRQGSETRSHPLDC